MSGLLGGFKNWLDCHAQRIVPTVGRPVTSGIPQGLILKPILFNIFNNTHDGMQFLGKFTNEAKLWGAVDKLESSAAQRDQLRPKGPQ